MIARTLARFRCRLERLPAGPMVELVAYAFPTGGVFGVGWPEAPGAAQHDAGTGREVLHFAPARWLVASPGPDVAARLDAAVEAGAAVVVDVQGKWQPFVLEGPGASRLLASTVDIAAVLEGRSCASVTLFDCPAIVAARQDGYVIWVGSSYATDFAAAVERLRDPA